MGLNQILMISAPIRPEIMQATRYTNARRAQRREEREERVRAGVPSARLDWQCPICERWYSNYRSRGTIHLRHCEKKGRIRIARKRGKPRRVMPKNSVMKDVQGQDREIVFCTTRTVDEDPGKSGSDAVKVHICRH